MPGLTSVAAWDLSDRLDDLAFSPDGVFLAGLSSSGRALAVRADDPGSATIWTAHAAGGLRLAWHPAASALATGGDDRQIHLWEPPATESCLVSRQVPAAVERLAWSPDGTLLASGDLQGTLEVLEVRRG